MNEKWGVVMLDLVRSVLHQVFDTRGVLGLKEAANRGVKGAISALTAGLFGGGDSGLGRDGYRGESPFSDVGGSRRFGRMMQGGAPTESGGGFFDRIGSFLKNAAASLLGVFLPGPQTTARLGPAFDSMRRNVESMIGGTDSGASGYNPSGYNQRMTPNDIRRAVAAGTLTGAGAHDLINGGSVDFSNLSNERLRRGLAPVEDRGSNSRNFLGYADPLSETGISTSAGPLRQFFADAASGEVRGQALRGPEGGVAPVFQNHYRNGLG